MAKAIRSNQRRGLRTFALALAASLAVVVPAWPQSSAQYGAPIQVELARKAAAATLVVAAKNKWLMAVAIVDAGGDLVYFERIDGTQTGSLGLAIAKAKAAAAYKRSTKVLEDRVVAGRQQYLLQTGSMPIEGGLPLILGGKVVGGLGVSGERSEQDGVAAEAGVTALRESP